MLPAKVASLNNCKRPLLMIYIDIIISVVPILHATKCFKNIFTHWGTLGIHYCIHIHTCSFSTPTSIHAKAIPMLRQNCKSLLLVWLKDIYTM